MNDFLYYICVPCTYLFKDVVTQYDFPSDFSFRYAFGQIECQKLNQNVVSKISWCLISIRKCERKLYQNQMESGSIWPIACSTDAESSGNLRENCFVLYIDKLCKKPTDYFSYHI